LSRLSSTRGRLIKADSRRRWQRSESDRIAMTQPYQGRRLVLHERRGEQRVRHFVRGLDARQVEETDDGADRVVIWRVSPTVDLYYGETTRPVASVVQVMGSDAAAVDKLTRLAAAALDPMGRTGIEAMSFSIWPEFRYALQMAALTDPSDDVRDAALTLLRVGYGEVPKP
jgi:hypothetical protein